MYKVRIEDSFAAAHFLRDYHGKCENLHGHNYKVRVYLRGENLSEGGMLYDFSDLKKDLKGALNTIDHTNLNDLPVFDQNPSAERIAVYIYNGIIDFLKNEGLDLSYKKGKKTPALYAVDVFETETSRARYRVDE